MFSWISFAKLMLQVVIGIVNFAKTKQLISAGEDREIARQSLEVLKATDEGKRIWDKINAMSEDDLGGLLADLGKPDAGAK